MIKKIIYSLTSTVKREEFNESKHKLCNECGGSGIDFIAGPCVDCDGLGFFDKTKEDKIKEALQYRKR